LEPLKSSPGAEAAAATGNDMRRWFMYLSLAMLKKLVCALMLPVQLCIRFDFILSKC
jgi:hypothetical protein